MTAFANWTVRLILAAPLAIFWLIGVWHAYALDIKWLAVVEIFIPPVGVTHGLVYLFI